MKSSLEIGECRIDAAAHATNTGYLAVRIDAMLPAEAVRWLVVGMEESFKAGMAHAMASLNVSPSAAAAAMPANAREIIATLSGSLLQLAAEAQRADARVDIVEELANGTHYPDCSGSSPCLRCRAQQALALEEPNPSGNPSLQ